MVYEKLCHWVGIDSEKRIVSEKRRKDAKRAQKQGEKIEKEAIKYGKSAHDNNKI